MSIVCKEGQQRAAEQWNKVELLFLSVAELDCAVMNDFYVRVGAGSLSNNDEPEDKRR